jgi:hypothetical protein
MIEYGNGYEPLESRHCYRMNVSNAVIGDSSSVIWQRLPDLPFSANPTPYDYPEHGSPQSVVF